MSNIILFIYSGENQLFHDELLTQINTETKLAGKYFNLNKGGCHVSSESPEETQLLDPWRHARRRCTDYLASNKTALFFRCQRINVQ